VVSVDEERQRLAGLAARELAVRSSLEVVWLSERGSMQGNVLSVIPTKRRLGLVSRSVGNNVNSLIRTSAIGLLQHLQLLYLPS
jgi:hypothetical protein